MQNGQLEAPKTQSAMLRVTNRQARTVQFVLEPWGEIYDMAAGASFLVWFLNAPENEPFEIVHEDNSITVYGTTGSTVRLFEAESETRQWREIEGSEARPIVPSLPSIVESAAESMQKAA